MLVLSAVWSLNIEGENCNLWTHIYWSYQEAWPVR